MNLKTRPSGRSRIAIHTLSASHPGKEEVDRFLEAHTFPLVEGPQVTFVFRGEVDAVNLVHWIRSLPSAQSFERIQGTDLWFLVMELPRESRVEYKLEIREGGNMRLIEDPLNPLRAHDPFGANSVCQAEGYEIPEWTQPDPDAREGVLEDWVTRSRALRSDRKVTVYRPARFRMTRRYPLLVVHDGPDFMHFAGLKTVLDNLIHRLEIPPIVVALTHPKDRLMEYANHDSHARYITEELVPQIEGKLPLLGEPSGRGLMGASFGAVASLTTAWRYPDFYGRLLLQSGSLAFSDIGEQKRGPLFDPVVQFMNSYREDPIPVCEKLFMTCGIYESFIYENRSLQPLLQATGMDVKYVESRDGHNWENWRDRLREGLSWLFPGPLWMVYE